MNKCNRLSRATIVALFVDDTLWRVFFYELFHDVAVCGRQPIAPKFQNFSIEIIG